MKTTIEILKEKGFHCSPNTYFNSFTGEFNSEFKRWSNQVTKPKFDFIRRYEGIEAAEFGFRIMFDYGKLCDISFMEFPKWATEDNFEGAFLRMVQYIR